MTAGFVLHLAIYKEYSKLEIYKIHLKFNFDILNTNVSKTMEMMKWFLSPNHFLCILPSISQILWFLEIFNQSHVVWDDKFWLYYK